MSIQAQLKACYEQRDALLDESQAITNLAEKENRELTEDEEVRFSAIVDEDNGELVQLKDKITKLEKRQREMKLLAEARHQSRNEGEVASLSQGELPEEGKSKEPEVVLKMARLRAFPNTEEGTKNAYFVGHWFRALNARKAGERDDKSEAILSSRGWEPRMAQTEDNDTAGGYLVPRPLSSTIIDIRENVGVARRLADIVPMSSKTEDVPKRTGGLTVYYPGEGNNITTSDMAFGRVNLVARKRAVANQISNEVSEDALVNMTDRAVNEMGYSLADKEDDEYINGDGTSTYGGEVGLLNALGTAGIYTPSNGGGESVWTGITQASLSAWKGKLQSKYWRRGQLAVLCSSAFYFNVFDRQQQGAGGNTGAMLREGFMFDIADAMWDGYPVFFSDKMPTATATSTVSALFGNFSMSTMLGDRVGANITMSADYAFLDDLTTLKSTARYDINCHELGDSSAAGGVVGLSTAAS